MIRYDPGIWNVSFAFSLDGSVFPKAFVWALPCALMSAVWRVMLTHSQEVTTRFGIGDVGATVFGGFTFILGFLIVFRSQQAYARWWEGGTLLQQLRGEWFNSYSCLVAFSNAAPEKVAEVRHFQHQLVRLFSLLYALALQQVSTLKSKKFELLDIDGLSTDSIRFLQNCPDRCEVTLQWIQRLIVESEANQTLKIAPPILSRVYNELGNGIVNLNNARKITDFPIPFPLAQMITVMLLFHAMVTPLIAAASVTTPYWAATITFVVIFSFWSINYIAVELEMPFGDDRNDLPLYEMQKDMNGSLRTLIDEQAQRVPHFHFQPEIHKHLKLVEVDFDADLIDYEKVQNRHTFKMDANLDGNGGESSAVDSRILSSEYTGKGKDTIDLSTREIVLVPTPGILTSTSFPQDRLHASNAVCNGVEDIATVCAEWEPIVNGQLEESPKFAIPAFARIPHETKSHDPRNRKQLRRPPSLTRKVEDQPDAMVKVGAAANSDVLPLVAVLPHRGQALAANARTESLTKGSPNFSI